MNKIITAICPSCKKPFLKLKKRNTSHYLPRGIRAFTCVTCSKNCSREYLNIIRHSVKYKTNDILPYPKG